MIFVFGAALAIGTFLLLCDALKLPALATRRAMLSAVRRDKSTTKRMEALTLGLAARIAPFLRMNEYKRRRMANTLTAAGLNITPELYTAQALVKAGCILSGVIPCLLVLPLLSPLVVVLAVLMYFRETKKADECLKAKRDAIEQELPRFAATITQELKAGRDVLSMLERFKKNAGEAFAGELDILTADMRSSSYESALTRCEARINSPLLSDITRGLIGVLRGDDSAVYFQMLSHDMKQLELQRLKARARKIPPKIRVFSFAMLLCFLLTYLVIIATEIVASLGTMF